jgi:hypothetical protein
MKVKKSGAYVLEMASTPPKPYKIWFADAVKCSGCGHVVITGFGDKPLAIHHEAGFAEYLEKVKNSETAKWGWLIEWHERLVECPTSPDQKHHWHQDTVGFSVVFICNHCDKRKE